MLQHHKDQHHLLSPNPDREGVDLNNCDREPIHIPDRIQPHGYLIAFSAAGKIQRLSENIQELTARPAEMLLNRDLKELIGEANTGKVLERLESIKQKLYLTLDIADAGGKVGRSDALLHRSENIFILELEPQQKSARGIDLADFNESMQELQESSSPESLASVAAVKFKQLTAFDRVMVYRFKEDGSGEVVAEEKEADLPPYLGLHYPASDIPQQARTLYLKNHIRLIPDVHYRPLAILPFENENNTPPLDLSYSSLRSVSPIHIQYLKNMGVRASMSVSIVKNNRLWGLFAFHHRQPFCVSYQQRQMCELLSRAFVMVLGEKEEVAIKSYEGRMKELKASLYQQMSRAAKFTDGLFKEEINVQQLICSGGCVLLMGSEYISLGINPKEEEVRKLAAWMQKHIQEEVFATHHLSALYPPAEGFAATGSGLLAVTISQVQQEYIIWFRPEQVSTVHWAGKQEKLVLEEEGEVQLHPRKSFEVWSEQVRNTSEAWLPLEIEMARELRTLVVDMTLRLSGELKLRADILSRINKEYSTAKDELDSFAFIASHDLKEPLRGIHSYATFLLEDYGSQLDMDGQAKLKTLMRLSDRMQQLVESLLQFSRVGRLELEVKEVDLQKVVEDVLDMFAQQISQEGIEICLGHEWPVISCDELRVMEVFMNLISNSIKYNDRENKFIKISCRKAGEDAFAPSGYVFYVQDNGIGIRSEFHEEIFNIFRRLHPRERFGGGMGAGLAISKKIVERHGGSIWVESQPGQGSCFFFTL